MCICIKYAEEKPSQLVWATGLPGLFVLVGFVVHHCTAFQFQILKTACEVNSHFINKGYITELVMNEHRSEYIIRCDAIWGFYSMICVLNFI
jgi:hypothetical protein